MSDRITYAKNTEWIFKTGEIRVMFVELLWLEYTSTLLLLIWKAKEGAGEEQEHRLTSNDGIMAADSVLV